MRKSKMLRIVMLCAAVLAVALTFYAEDAPAQIDDGDPEPSLETRERLTITWQGRDDMPPRARILGLYMVEQNPNHYLHRPVFALIPGSDDRPYSRRSPRANGEERWIVTVLMSSRGIRDGAINTLLTSDRVKAHKDFSMTKLRVDLYQVRSGTVRCYALLDPDATLAAGTLSRDSDQADIREFILDVPDPKRFLAAYKDRDARCDINYQYLRRQVAAARRVQTFEASATQVLEGFQSAARIPGGVGTATDRANTMAKLSVVQSDNVLANSSLAANAVPKIETLSAQLFTLSNLDFAKVDGVTKDALEAYLRAETEKVTREKRQVDTTTDKSTSDLSLTIGPKDGPVSISPSIKNELEKRTEITFVNGAEKNSIAPGSIAVYKLVSGWKTLLAETSSTYVLSRPVADGGITEQIDLSLTQEITERQVGVGAAAPEVTGLLPGMAFCYFGAGDIPAGWVAMDGEPGKRWPRSNWVPRHLQDKPLPDMRGTTVVGASQPEQVGLTKKDTALRFPPFTAPKTISVFALGETAKPMTVTPANAGFNRRFIPTSQFDNGAPPRISNPIGLGDYVPFDPLISSVVLGYPVDYLTYPWVAVKAFQTGSDPGMPSWPAMNWGDENSPPYTKCRWLMKL